MVGVGFVRTSWGHNPLIGKTIAHYTVGEKIGAGGMGEVYRATDTKLNRDVALKVLPEEFAKDHDRMSRFKREAQVLASLNHPNIAAIYGLEEENGVQAIVLELVEGPTLAERIKQSAIPLEEALNIAKQIAEAVESAHEQGVIHRDLKPANVKVKEDGQVKVLDFGLAKALEGELTEEEIGNSPTLSVAATRAGVILGTAAYMSPEQATGKKADKRADIWSFGVVLFEMLTGQRLFTGESVVEVMSKVMRDEPDWDSLPSDTPSSVRKVLRRCLERDRKRRLHDIADARLEIEETLSESSITTSVVAAPEPTQIVWKQAVPWVLAGALALVLIAMVFRTPSSSTGPLMRFVERLPDSQYLLSDYEDSAIALSPDGRLLVYSAVDMRDGRTKLFLRRLDHLEADSLPGTEDAGGPFFSPDGKWLGFRADNKLKKILLAGGAAVEVADHRFGGADWARDDSIVYTKDYNTGLFRVPAAGGEPEMLTKPDIEKGELGHWWPQVLPGGRAILYTSYTPPVKNAKIEVLDLSSGEQRTLVKGALFGRYLSSGHLVYSTEETLMAVPFDVESLQITGAPVPVLNDVAVDLTGGFSHYSFSADGTLAYFPASILSAESELVWVDRRGNISLVTESRRRYEAPALSPDGRRLAVFVNDENRDVWVQELARNITTRLTFEPTHETLPVWTPDGRKVIYRTETRAFDLGWKAADGSSAGELLYVNGSDKHPQSVSPDGKFLLFVETQTETLEDIWLFPLEGERKAEPFLRTPFEETKARFSPDGRWVAYQSNESGRFEIYIRAFTGKNIRIQVSTDGGDSPVWSRDGREIYFRRGQEIVAVSVRSGGSLRVGFPRVLFEGDFFVGNHHPMYDVAADGRFLMIRTPDEELPRQIHIVLNWFEELRRLAPSN